MMKRLPTCSTSSHVEGEGMGADLMLNQSCKQDRQIGSVISKVIKALVVQIHPGMRRWDISDILAQKLIFKGTAPSTKVETRGGHLVLNSRTIFVPGCSCPCATSDSNITYCSEYIGIFVSTIFVGIL